MHVRRVISAICLLALGTFSGCSPVPRPSRPETAGVLPSGAIVVPNSSLGQPLRFVIYGDMRFTTTAETELSNPGARQALVARIAFEHPQALFLTGDVPLHGGNQDDYREFAQETGAWRAESLRVFPVLGNHEFQQCAEAECLEHWWQAFPQQQGRRWYSVMLGSQMQFFALDSDASLLPDSEQAKWLQQQIDTLPERVRFVLLLLHHPPMTDASRGARANEEALTTLLASAASHSQARFIVCAAHVHNYERFERDGIVFLVSGGGGAKPSPVTRSAAAIYKGGEFPNFHYLRFELSGTTLRGEMVRLSDPDAPGSGVWAVQDRFEVQAGR